MASGVYNRFKANLLQKDCDLSSGGDTLKVALLTSAHSFSADDNTWGGISANEVSGTGYTAGGDTLANQSVTQDNTNDKGYFDADNTTWSSSTVTARFAAIYDDTLANDDLIACIDFGSDKSSSNGDFTIQWSTSGIVELS